MALPDRKAAGTYARSLAAVSSPIHRSAWQGCSANFGRRAFQEVRGLVQGEGPGQANAPALLACYAVGRTASSGTRPAEPVRAPAPFKRSTHAATTHAMNASGARFANGPSRANAPSCVRVSAAGTCKAATATPSQPADPPGTPLFSTASPRAAATTTVGTAEAAIMIHEPCSMVLTISGAPPRAAVTTASWETPIPTMRSVCVA